MFSWLFGSGGDKNGSGGSAAPPPPPKDATLDVLSSGIDENMKLPASTTMDRFDPSVLERIASAAKELSKSGKTVV